MRFAYDLVGAGCVSRLNPYNSRPRRTVIAMKALLFTQPVKDCALSMTLVELMSQTPNPRLTRYEGRVDLAALSARATPIAPVSRASRG